MPLNLGKGATSPTIAAAMTESLCVCVSIDIYIARYMPRVDPRSPASLLPLRSNWFHVLLCLADREQHGYAIMQEVRERTDGKVRLWPATLYGSLRRLMEEDLIEECDRRPAGDLDDLRRRYYRLSPFGRRVLTAEIARLEELLKAARAKRRTLGTEASR